MQSTYLYCAEALFIMFASATIYIQLFISENKTDSIFLYFTIDQPVGTGPSNIFVELKSNQNYIKLILVLVLTCKKGSEKVLPLYNLQN